MSDKTALWKFPSVQRHQRVGVGGGVGGGGEAESGAGGNLVQTSGSISKVLLRF